MTSKTATRSSVNRVSPSRSGYHGGGSRTPERNTDVVAANGEVVISSDPIARHRLDRRLAFNVVPPKSLKIDRRTIGKVHYYYMQIIYKYLYLCQIIYNYLLQVYFHLNLSIFNIIDIKSSCKVERVLYTHRRDVNLMITWHTQTTGRSRGQFDISLGILDKSKYETHDNPHTYNTFDATDLYMKEYHRNKVYRGRGMTERKTSILFIHLNLVARLCK